MMRPFTMLATAFALAALASTVVFAQSGDERPEGPPPGRPAADRPDGDRGPRDFGRHGFFRGEFRPPQMPLITALDANKDGEISAEEIANATAALKSLDKNEDGKLTREEMRPQFAAEAPDGRRDREAPPPDDRRADRPERRGPSDGDRPKPDDRGPRPEFGRGPGFGGPGPLIDHVMRLDADDDQQLSQEEVLKLFTAADRNTDGFISRTELEDAVREHIREQVAKHGLPPHRPPHEERGPRGDRGPEHDRPDRPNRPE
ncbi:MAG: hypothetical protein AB7U20_04235 [Planctomycetaceae bacterium]